MIDEIVFCLSIFFAIITLTWSWAVRLKSITDLWKLIDPLVAFKRGDPPALLINTSMVLVWERISFRAISTELWSLISHATKIALLPF